MSANLEYDCRVKSLNRALVAVFAALTLTVVAHAQINAAPPSVTSMGFGGRAINGAPPSVTSLGRSGYTPGFNPAFPNSKPFLGAVPGQNHPHHRNNAYLPWGGAYYAVPYGYYDEGDQASSDPPDQYNGGPTIFDRRGPGSVPRPPEAAYDQPPAAPNQEQPADASSAIVDQPTTVLVFKDGRQVEVENYAIVGNTLYDLSGGGRHKIPLTDLDLDATTKQNDDRGIDFTVPSGT
jgi:hypothetical protein